MKRAREDGDDGDECATDSSDTNSTLDVDIDGIVESSASLDSTFYGNSLLENAKKYSEKSAEFYVASMIGSIMLMAIPVEPNRPPFEPRFRLATGERSAAPSDFDGPELSVIEAYAKKTSIMAIKARLCHLTWFLDPKQKNMGEKALELYVAILEHLVKDKSKTSSIATDVDLRTQEMLRLAYSVLSNENFSNTYIYKLNCILSKVFRKYENTEGILNFLQIVEIAISTEKVEPKFIIDALLRYSRSCGSNIAKKHRADIWRLLAAVQAFFEKDEKWLDFKRREGDIYANLYESCIDSKNGKSKIELYRWLLVAANNVVSRNDGRSKYLEYQEAINSTSKDVEAELSAIYKKRLHYRSVSIDHLESEEITLSEALHIFTVLEIIPDSDTLLKQAKGIVEVCPTFCLLDSPPKIPTAMIGMDTHGSFKTMTEEEIYRTQILHIENIRRRASVRDKIEYYRYRIGYSFRPSAFIIRELIFHSPVVPLKSVDNISEGFARYFQGDLVSAFYILVPHIEGILREALSACGYSSTVLKSIDAPTHERSLSSVLASMRGEMEAIFGDAILSDIERVFHLKGGPCIKHNVAHARFNDTVPFDADANYACWLIWYLVALPLVSRWNEVMPKI